jgi:hypothetical protein
MLDEIDETIQSIEKTQLVQMQNVRNKLVESNSKSEHTEKSSSHRMSIDHEDLGVSKKTSSITTSRTKSKH